MFLLFPLPSPASQRPPRVVGRLRPPLRGRTRLHEERRNDRKCAHATSLRSVRQLQREPDG